MHARSLSWHIYFLFNLRSDLWLTGRDPGWLATCPSCKRCQSCSEDWWQLLTESRADLGWASTQHSRLTTRGSPHMLLTILKIYYFTHLDNIWNMYEYHANQQELISKLLYPYHKSSGVWLVTLFTPLSKQNALTHTHTCTYLHI